MELTLPKFEETVQSAVIIKWLKAPGESVAKDEPLVEIETEKFTHEMESPVDAIIVELKVLEGVEVPVGTVLAILEPLEAGAVARATPLAAAAPATPATALAEPVPPAPAADPAATARPLGPARRAMLENLSRSRANVVPCTTTLRVDVTRTLEMRKDLAEVWGGLSLTALLAAAISRGMRQFPTLGGQLDGDQVLLPTGHHIGIAVPGKAVTTVAVVRDCERKGLLELSRELKELQARAAAGTLSATDCQGSVFTLTNVGPQNVDSFTPVIRWPEAAILGVGTTRDDLTLDSGLVCRRKVSLFCLTYDHRFVDGPEAVGFLDTIRLVLENPWRLLIP